jgi:hypothetical protein
LLSLPGKHEVEANWGHRRTAVAVASAVAVDLVAAVVVVALVVAPEGEGQEGQVALVDPMQRINFWLISLTLMVMVG